jgi:teichuronic acid biosynthesis glycosyltransferase TuaC
MTVSLLTFTTLYPDSTRPTRGIFVENRLRHLLAGSSIVSRVMAPVPWFPFKASRFGSYAQYARVPTNETRNGIMVAHPRYPLIPKLGMTAAPWLMAAAVRTKLAQICRNGYDFNVIDAHYFYPDGVAAALLGRRLHKPVVITARGSDLNLFADYFFPRHMIRWAAKQAAALITVSQSLKDKLVELGIDPPKIRVLRNGVDLALFRPPEDRQGLRERLQISRPTLLSVGNLDQVKGHDLILRSLIGLPGFDLIIVGTGPDESILRKQVGRLDLASRVRFVGQVAHEKLTGYYGAADALVLGSSREGWPNVLLESMACGTPAVAFMVGGVPEIIACSEAGLLIKERNADSLVEGVLALFSKCPDRAATRRYAEGFGWEATTRGQEALFAEILHLAENSMNGRFKALTGTKHTSKLAKR